MKLRDALSGALMWNLEVDPIESVAWGMNDSPNELADAILADPDFRAALVESLPSNLTGSMTRSDFRAWAIRTAMPPPLSDGCWGL